jgi:hypothetical protein
LLKIMVMLEGAPADFTTQLSPQHAELCTRGQQLRAQLPSSLIEAAWQRAAVVTYYPLHFVVAAYAVVTTPEDMWVDGLQVQEPQAKRGRTETADKEDDED